ncbi:MAG: hypothetical protein NVS1B4_20880 [Gemmatimonadaceae bacterium]
MRFPSLALAASAAVLSLASVAPAQSVTGGSPSTTSTARKPILRDRQLVCRGAQVPAGWVVVTDTRDPSMCTGDQSAATVNSYNIWAIERFDDRPVGSVMEICASSPSPDGWQLVDVYRSHERCGHPDELFATNVKRIKRLR